MRNSSFPRFRCRQNFQMAYTTQKKFILMSGLGSSINSGQIGCNGRILSENTFTLDPKHRFKLPKSVRSHSNYLNALLDCKNSQIIHETQAVGQKKSVRDVKENIVKCTLYSPTLRLNKKNQKALIDQSQLDNWLDELKVSMKYVVSILI